MAQGFGLVGLARRRRHTPCISSLRARPTEPKIKPATRQVRCGEVLGLTLSAALLVGCAYGEMRQVLRAQVASEANCPELQVSKVPAYAEGYAENQYKVLGCGIDRVYTCNDSGGLVKYGSADCKYVAAAAPKAPAAPPPTDDTGGGEMEDEGASDLGADDNG